MKKNIIGHMQAQKEPMGSKLKRWHVLPRLLCLALAVVIWLAVCAISDQKEVPEQDGTSIGDVI